VAVSTYGYDDASRLQSLTTVSGGNTLAAYWLTYTDDGQIQQAQSYADAASPATWATTACCTGCDKGIGESQSQRRDL